MNKKESYSELLKNPKWQKMRLEILRRDNFTCQICGCKDKPLHVHHIHYDKNKKPWEYDEGALITLCEDCHDKEHRSRYSILEVIQMLQAQGFLMIEIEAILDEISVVVAGLRRPDGVVVALGSSMDEHDDDDETLCWALDFSTTLCKNIASWRAKLPEYNKQNHIHAEKVFRF